MATKILSSARQTLRGMSWRTYTVVVVVTALLAGLGVDMSRASTNAPTQSQPASTSSPVLAGFRQGMVQVTGSRMHYVIGGSGPALVLLPSWPETWWEWHYILPGLSRDHTVIALDMPGLGGSSIPSGGYDSVTTALRIHEAVNALGFRHVGVVGHGLTNLPAYVYARKYPKEVTRLMVMDSPLPGFGLEKYYGLSFHLLLNQEPYPIPEHIVNDRAAEVTYLNYMFKGFTHKPANVLRDIDVYYAAYANPANRSAGYDYFRAFSKDAKEDLALASHKLTIPVLAMGGQYSFGTAVAPSFDQVATDVHSIVAPGAAHYIPEEVPGFLAECAQLFFSSSAHPKSPSSEYDACVP